MNGFFLSDNQLLCDDLPLEALAAEYGTPLYVYSAARVRANLARVAGAFAALDAQVRYAIKANGNLALLRLLAAGGCGFDAVSGGEIYRALQADADPARIAFAGAGKTGAELAYALEAGVGCLIVEAPDELARAAALAAAAGTPARVALRLNPGVHAHTHAHLDTGHAGSKFGIPFDAAVALFAEHARYAPLVLDGVHVHIGSQNMDTAATVAAARQALALVAAARAAGAPVTRLDLGGGFPVAYRPDESVPGPEVFAQALAPLLAGQGLELLIEPGRALVADAGALIVTVQSVKEVGGTRVVVVDGGMNDLLRPALYGAYHHIVPVEPPSAPFGDADRMQTPHGGPLEPADVAGPICESADYFGRARPLPPLAPGDRLAVLTAGAYGMSMASQYNARPRPAEVLVDGGAARVVRRRETWDDLVAHERGA
jgi:diaminopimelate decarboxylase